MKRPFHMAINAPLPRLCLALCLVLAMVLGGVQGALACVARGPVVMMEICGDGMARTAWVDAQGQPVQTPLPEDCSPCAKCLAQGALAIAGGALALAPAPASFGRLAAFPPVAAPGAAPVIDQTARGPPQLV